MAALKAGTLYFAAVFALGFVLGTLRVLVVIPALYDFGGETAAIFIELPIILTGSWFICRWIVTRYAVPTAINVRAAMGAIAFALLMIAETVLSVTAFGQTMGEHFAAYATFNGALGLGGQIVFALFPLAQLRGARDRQA